MAYNPFMASSDTGDSADGSGSSSKNPFLVSTRGADAYRKKKQQEDQQNSDIAATLKKTQADKAQTAKDLAEKNQNPAGKILGGIGSFIKNAAVDVKDTTVGAYQGTKTMIDSISANSAVNHNADLMQKNNKEWSAYTNSILGNAASADATPELKAKWDSPDVQEKLKEFKYKAALLQGKPVAPEDTPKSALDAQAQVIQAHKDGTIGPNGQPLAFTVGKGGQVLANPNNKTGPIDPYQQYRDGAVTDGTKKTLQDLQSLDAKKLAAQDAETFLNIATLGVGTAGKQIVKEGVIQGVKAGVKEGAKTAVKTASKEILGTTGKDLAAHAGKDALVGGAYGVTQTLRNDPENKAGLSDYAKNMLLGASIGAALPIAGKTVEHVVKPGLQAADRAVGAQVQKAGEKALAKTTAGKAAAAIEDPVAKAAAEDTAMRRSLQQIGQDGIMGTIDKSLSHAGKAVTYAVGDAFRNTKVGQKATNLTDDFAQKWISSFSPLYKVLKRSDFEGKTDGAYLAARNAIGNSNRALSYAADYVEHDPHMQQLQSAIAATGTDLKGARAKFDEFSAVKSELDLAAAGKKTFSKAKMADLNNRMSAFADKPGYNDMHQNLVDFYSRLNDFKLENGLMSPEEHKMWKDEPFDYVRQQREIPQWLQDKPQGGGNGSSAASIGKSNLTQKRNQFAQGEVLSPIETAIKTAQLAHTEAYRNKAAKTIYSLLDEAGDASLVRSTDMVNEKNALLSNLKASKPIVTKLDKTVRTYKKAAGSLQTQMNQLSKEGLDLALAKGDKAEIPQAFRYVTKTEVANPKRVSTPTMSSIGAPKEITGTATDRLAIEGGANTRKLIKAMVTEDPARLKQIRTMLESRDSKLTPLLDSIEVMNQNLHDLHQQRSGMWDAANSIKTTVDKKHMTTMDFLDGGITNTAKIDPAIASALHNWEKQSQNVMMDVLRRANNVFKYGTTGANVGFALPNFVADQFNAAINSHNFAAQVSPVNFVHSLFMTMGKPLNAQDAEWLHQYKAGNAGQTSINQYTKRATASREADRLIGQGAGVGKNIYTNIRHPVTNGMKQLFDGLESGIATTENMTRIQSFRGAAKTAVKKGMDTHDVIRTANQAARENSVDFQEMGDYGRVVNNLIPYFNASIQGSRTILRNASEHPATFAAKTAALIGVPIAATTIWNTSDPKRNEIYKTIPDYVKQTNFIVIQPGAHWNTVDRKWNGVILIKKPQGVKEFAEPIRKFIEYKADGGANMSDFLKTQAGSMATDFAGGLEPINFSDPNKFLSSVTPQILKPTAEAILNRTFFTGQDIVPQSMQDQAPQDQKYANYSRLSASIAGMFGTSPLKVDTWIKETFGEAGTNVQNSVDRIDNNDPNSIGGRSLTESVQRRFSGAPGGADTTAFYDSYNKANSARKVTSAKVTELVKAGRINEAKRRAEEYNQSIGGRLQSFMDNYKNSPNYDTAWDDKINSLPIKTSESAFTARRKQ